MRAARHFLLHKSETTPIPSALCHRPVARLLRRKTSSSIPKLSAIGCGRKAGSGLLRRNGCGPIVKSIVDPVALTVEHRLSNSAPMRKLFVYGLAIVGAVYLLGTGSRAMRRFAPDPGVRVVLQDHSRRPIRSASVFVDIGRGAIDRFVVDSSGIVLLPLTPGERRNMRLLICAPGFLSTAYGGGGEDLVESRFSLLDDNGSGSRFVRSNGWYGPIPRECPQPADSVGWYAAVPGVADRAIRYAEPDWSQQPKRPRP